jgi:drug/metabolite transporter (DMT)-like permease
MRSPALPTSGQGLGILLVLISACGFGSGPLFVQPLYAAEMEPITVLFWRFASAALLSWGFLLASRRTRSSLRTLPTRRIAILLLLGVLYVGNSGTYIASLEVVPISLSSIITYIYPAIVAVMATRFVRRLEGRRAWFALAMSMLGVALAVGGVPEGTLPPLWGLALAFASPVIYSVWIILQARLAGDRPESLPADAEAGPSIPDPAPAAALMTSATAMVYALLVLGTGGSVSPLDVPQDVWWALLGLGFVATALAIQAFYAGVRRVGGARAALISTVEPVYTIVLAMLLFRERLSALQLIGGALVIGAVILAETGRQDEPSVPRRALEPEVVSPRPADGLE